MGLKFEEDSFQSRGGFGNCPFLSCGFKALKTIENLRMLKYNEVVKTKLIDPRKLWKLHKVENKNESNIPI